MHFDYRVEITRARKPSFFAKGPDFDSINTIPSNSNSKVRSSSPSTRTGIFGADHQINSIGPAIMSNLPRELEIVGLYASNNGRSCCIHATCGESVQVSDLLRLVKCVVTVKGKLEEAIKCVRVVQGEDSCYVAYVPRLLAKTPKILKQVNNFCAGRSACMKGLLLSGQLLSETTWRHAVPCLLKTGLPESHVLWLNAMRPCGCRDVEGDGVGFDDDRILLLEGVFTFPRPHDKRV